MHPLVAEAMKKAAVAWLGVAGLAPHPVWCVWADDALFVVSGPGEQPAPGLAQAGTATVTARGDHGGRIVTWSAIVERVSPDSDTWATVVVQLAGKRLNSTGAAELVRRWAHECVVVRLTPTDEPPADRPAGSLAAPPRPTPAARVARKPLRLHRVKGRRR